MNEADKKRIAELNAELDAKMDKLLGFAIETKWTPWVIVAWTLLAVWFGTWLAK